MEGNELRRVQELLVVSTLGLIVNMVGLLAFGHAHAGHDHGHGHSHTSVQHDHSHSHSQSHSRTQSASHTHNHSHHDSHSHNGHAHHRPSTSNVSLYAPPSLEKSGHNTQHHHSHENENMHGIYLHVAADAGGSLAVIISTALTLWKPWYLWDPLATILIASLIFVAAVPLVQTSAKKLLLVIPDDMEYGLKNAMQELVGLRGVAGYAVPRFWIEDGGGGEDVDGHAHHGHDHDHGHGHGHDHGEGDKEKKLMGVIHIFASRAASLEDVRERVVHFFAERNMDVVVQVEREGEGRCWCGGGTKAG